MMIMSVFVAVPTYNVGADEGDYVCYDMDTHEVDWGYETEEECVDAGLMWVEADSGPEDDGGEPEAFHATMTMESLEDWMVDFYAEMPVDWSDDAREDVSMMCADMMGTDEDEITEDCFDHWMDMVMSDGDGHGYDDEFRCPPEMDDATCETLMECDEGDADMFECMTAMYNYCYDNDSEMCDDMMSGDDDDGG